MRRAGGRGKDTTTCLLASCVSSARWVLVAAFAAVLVFSTPLAIISSPFKATHSSHKAPHAPITKAKALSTTSERFSLSCGVAHGRATKHLSFLSNTSPSYDVQRPKSIVRPLRC
jgi:hypothetical protein